VLGGLKLVPVVTPGGIALASRLAVITVELEPVAGSVIVPSANTKVTRLELLVIVVPLEPDGAVIVAVCREGEAGKSTPV